LSTNNLLRGKFAVRVDKLQRVANPRRRWLSIQFL